MKKTFNVDAKLLKDAKAACGAATDTDTLRMCLEMLVRHAAYQALTKFIGSEPDAEDVPRFREPVEPRVTSKIASRKTKRKAA